MRHNQMESIFLSAVDMYGHDFHPENLQKLIQSETSIFDILHDFFYHTNRAVCNAALEVNISSDSVYNFRYVVRINTRIVSSFFSSFIGTRSSCIHFVRSNLPATPGVIRRGSFGSFPILTSVIAPEQVNCTSYSRSCPIVFFQSPNLSFSNSEYSKRGILLLGNHCL